MREIARSVKLYEDAINQGKIIGSKCNECEEISVPPRPLCRMCKSTNIKIEEVKGEGKLITWTTVHFSSPLFEKLVPYTVAIVELENGERLTGIIAQSSDKKLEEKLETGMDVTAMFDENTRNSGRLRWKLTPDKLHEVKVN